MDRGGTGSGDGPELGGGNMDTDMDVANVANTAPTTEVLSELGKLALKCDTICQNIITVLLK